MKIKLMAFDLDNTLLNTDGIIEESTMQSLHRCMDAGVHIAIATGRMYPSAKIAADIISTNTPIICYNGACLRGRNDAKPVKLFALNKDVQKEITEFCIKENLFLQMYSDDKIIVTEHNHYSQGDPDSQNAEVVEVGTFDLNNLPDTPKMMIYNTTEKIQELLALLKPKYENRAYMAQSTSILLEIMDANVNKGYALASLAETLGIKQCEVAAFGDNTNDLEMVEWAGYGVSVANGVQILKDNAAYICTKNRNKGVEEAIEYMFTNELI